MSTFQSGSLSPADIVELTQIVVLVVLFMEWRRRRSIETTKAHAYDVIQFILDAKQAKDSSKASRVHGSFSRAVVVDPREPTD